VRRAILALTASLLVFAGTTRTTAARIPPFGGAAAYVADLTARRARLMSAVGNDALVVLWSANPRVYSTDTNYEFRQESNLLYLTGIEQEGAILVLVPGDTAAPERLFIPRSDPYRELWFGHLLTPEEATAASGIRSVTAQEGTQAFDEFISRALGAAPAGAPDGLRPFAAARAAGKARLCVLERVPAPGSLDAAAAESDVVDSHADWVTAQIGRSPGVTPCTVAPILDRQRQLKTPYEQQVLRRSVEISAEAHVEGMKATRPGRWEYEVEAAIEYWFHRNGALSWGYPSIVASGPNATTLHYEQSTRQMQDGDLLLVDAAGNFQGLTGDITRTYPVNGRFTRAQRAIYDLVLKAQDAGLAAARPGAHVGDINTAIRAVFAAGLQQLGLVDPRFDVARQVSLWFPHSPTHGIGMDVHEPLGALLPGTAFVIEPGLYIRDGALTSLPPTPENAAIVEALRPALERYRDIGVRIEDSFLMTEGGPDRMSSTAPREPDAIEAIVGTGR
jgi:Xaa-Pro aminopeptidase